MVQRQFAAFNNEAFTVDASSPSLSPGSAIINNSGTPVGTIFQFTPGFDFQTILLEDTSAEPDVFNDQDEDNHIITDGSGLVQNGTPVESESYHFLRALDANGNPTGDVITINVYSQNGDTADIWGMSSDTKLLPGVRYVKTGGSSRGDSLYESFVPCFTHRSLVETQKGKVRIQDLTTHHCALTRDNGFQPIRWIGTKDLTSAQIVNNSRLRPIRIAKGAIAENVPYRTMIVSPNHRMLIASPHLSMHFNENEMLIAAKHLVGLPGIDLAPLGATRYVHLLCDSHEVLKVDDAWTESFQPGDYAMTGLGGDQTREVLDLFPELAGAYCALAFQDARMVLKGYEAEILRNAWAA